jgi:transcriptional regulator with GAF, ATPase, and Fis domain
MLPAICDPWELNRHSSSPAAEATGDPRAASDLSDAFAGGSPALQDVLTQARRVAATSATVLVIGETGTGKGLVASYVHAHSERRHREMICVNCAAIPSTLIESELFGHERGAYTDAFTRQIGRFELADCSTIFLDEIGDLSAEVQVKLLRVLEERQIERLGSVKSVTIDTRVIAATHQALEHRIEDGSFRADLFYRLNVFPLRVPPLRDRAEDIPVLIWHFVEHFSAAFGKSIEEIPDSNMAALQRYSWPGNIRELRNAVERAMIQARGPRLTIAVPTPLSVAALRSQRLIDVQRDHIRKVLETSGWRIRGAGGAAERLGLPPTTLETRMIRLGVTRPRALSRFLERRLRSWGLRLRRTDAPQIPGLRSSQSIHSTGNCCR